MAKENRLMLGILQILSLSLPCLSTLPSTSSCQSSTYLPDKDNCHYFWHCHQGLTEAKSCGFMMWNPVKQVCDWPNKVVQLRPECADEHKLNQMMSSPWQRARTQRMLRFLGPRTQSFEAVPRGNQNRYDSNKIAVQSITEMITNRIREQISQRVPKAVVEHRTDNNMKNNDGNLMEGDAEAVFQEETRENKDLKTFPEARKHPNKGERIIKCHERKNCSTNLRKVKKFLLNNRSQLQKRRMHLAARRKQGNTLLAALLKNENSSNNKLTTDMTNEDENDNDDDLAIDIKMGFNDNDFIVMNESFSRRDKLDPNSNKLLLLKSVVQQVKNEVEDIKEDDQTIERGAYVNSDYLRYN